MGEYTVQDLKDNINYLSETKNKIKQSIIAKGQLVEDTDTFRSYSNYIDNIQSNLYDRTDTVYDASLEIEYYEIVPKSDMPNGSVIIYGYEPISGEDTDKIGVLLFRLYPYDDTRQKMVLEKKYFNDKKVYTDDATANANNVEWGYTAYVNDKKVTGTLPIYNSEFLDMPILSINNSINRISTSSKVYSKYILNNPHTISTSIPFNNVSNLIGLTPKDLRKGVTILDIEGRLEDKVKYFNSMEEMNVSNTDELEDGQLGLVYNITDNVATFDGLFRYDYTNKVWNLAPTQFTATDDDVFAVPYYGANGSSVGHFNTLKYMNDTTKTKIVDYIGIYDNLYSTIETSNVTDMSPMFYGSNISQFTFNNVINVTNMSQMFASCNNLRFVSNTINLNAPNCTNITNMFTDCNNLTSIDLYNANFSNVLNMDYMFFRCKNLFIANLSNVNFSNVLTAKQIFQNCGSLSVLNMSSVNLINATNVSYMFYGCTKMLDINLFYINFSNVINSDRMFDNCFRLENIIMPNASMNNLVNATRMFYNCTNVKQIVFMSYPNNLADSSNMFYNCTSLNNIFGFNTTNLVNLRNCAHMFYNCTNLITGIPFNWDLTNTTNMYRMFYNCYNTVYYVNITNTDNVTNAGECFYMCSLNVNMNDVNLYKAGSSINFYYYFGDNLNLCNTKINRNLKSMFATNSNLSASYGKSSRFRLNITNLNISNLNSCYGAFRDRKNMDIYGLDTLDFSNCTDYRYCFEKCTSFVKYINIQPKVGNIDMSYMFSNSNMAMHPDSNFNTSNVINMAYMFANNPGVDSWSWGTSGSIIEAIARNFNTINCLNMYGMFLGCRNIDINSLSFSSNWNTYKVNCMDYMFLNFGNLVNNMNISNFNVTNVKYANGIFMNSNIVNIISDNLSFDNLLIASYMFYNCNNLKSVQGNWYLPKVSNISYTFQNCRSLENIDFLKITGNNLQDISGVFKNCISIKNLDLSSWDVSNVTSAYDVFNGCSSLESVNISNWNLSKLSTFPSNFLDVLGKLKTVDMSNINLSNINNIPDMFKWGTNLQDVNMSNIKLGNNVKASYWFYHANNINNLTITIDSGSISPDMMFYEFNSSNIGRNLYMGGNIHISGNTWRGFSGAEGVFNLDEVQNWNTENLISCSYLLESWNNMSSIDLTNWDMSKVSIMYGMFSQCTNLKSINVSTWNTSNCTNMMMVFNNCLNLVDIDTSQWNMSKVTDIEKMFSFCNNLSNESIDNIINMCLNATNVVYKNLNSANGTSPFYHTNITSDRYQSRFDELTSAGWVY